MLYRFLLLFVLGMLFVQCKSKSPIVTSKEEAIRRGNYRTDYAKSHPEKENKKGKTEKNSDENELATVHSEQKESKKHFDKKAHKNLSKKIHIFLILTLFSLGCIIQLIGNLHVFNGIIDKVLNFNATHRNFLFFCLPFFLIGYLINKYEN